MAYQLLHGGDGKQYLAQKPLNDTIISIISNVVISIALR